MKTKDLKLFALEYINLQESLSSDDKIQMFGFVQEATREEVMSMLFTGQARTLEEGEDKFVTDLFEMTIDEPMSEILTEAASTPLLKLGDPNDPKWQAARAAYKSAFKGIWNTAVKGNKDALRKLTHVTARSTAKDQAGIIKTLASKWASYKVPDAKQIPSWLGGGAVGRGETAAQWGKNYDQAMKAIKVGAPIAAAVVTAMVLMVARKAYKAYFTKAARACKGTSGMQKNECIRKFKVDGVKAQIQMLENGKKSCQASSNPGKCSAKIDQRIHKKKTEITKLMSKKKVR